MNQIIRKIESIMKVFKKGKNLEIKQELINKMQQASKNENFEEAALIRDRIKAISKISFEQYSDLNKNEDFDIVFMYQKYGQVFIQIFFYRTGKNFGNKEFVFTNIHLDGPEIIFSQFLIFFYTILIFGICKG